MNIRREREEPARGEGLGSRVRRFVDSEISRVMDKEDRETGTPVYRETGTPVYDETGTRVYDETGTPVRDYDVPAPVPRAAETEPERLTGYPHDEAPTERMGLLNDPAGLRTEWQRVQSTFVDDPQRAVQEASVLVNRTLQEIHENVARGHAGDSTSTEELRVSFQHYREFFQRLLLA